MAIAQTDIKYSDGYINAGDEVDESVFTEDELATLKEWGAISDSAPPEAPVEPPPEPDLGVPG